jgi:hypothetical protein
MEKRTQRLQTEWLVILTYLVITLFGLIYPIYVIRPFRHQGVQELAVALVVLRFRGIVSAICVALAIVATIRYWRLRPNLWRRIGGVAGAVGVCLAAALSHVNVYELMFHPLGRPSFAPVAESRLDKDEKVLAILVNGVARAYPIRGISYHHIVNDVVGGVPIVATY